MAISLSDADSSPGMQSPAAKGSAHSLNSWDSKRKALFVVSLSKGMSYSSSPQPTSEKEAVVIIQKSKRRLLKYLTPLHISSVK